MSADFLARSELLIGTGGLERLKNSRVLVLGIGGVGGYALEQLARAGIGRLTIVDGDRIDDTNRNRQLIALKSTVGQLKTDAWRRRILDINPDAEVEAIPEFITGEAIPALLETPYDFVVEAIDTLAPKVHFIRACVERRLAFISSMGSGGRLDPYRLQECDISKTYQCSLARAVRARLKHYGITKGVRVVFSPEPVPPGAVRAVDDAEGHHASMVGTISYLPAAFGLACAAAAIQTLLGERGEKARGGGGGGSGGGGGGARPPPHPPPPHHPQTTQKE